MAISFCPMTVANILKFAGKIKGRLKIDDPASSTIARSPKLTTIEESDDESSEEDEADAPLPARTWALEGAAR
jgi:hypothetical protein